MNIKDWLKAMIENSEAASGYSINFKDWLKAMIAGAVISAIFIGLSHLLSRPVGEPEVMGAAISAAIYMAFVKRGRT